LKEGYFLKKRLDWLDVGKGLGIILVMLGHTTIPAPLKTYIYTFHMPLFFFLSGYLYKPEKFASFTAFLAKRTKSLLIPYFCFSLAAYVWFLFTFRLGLVTYDQSLLKPLIGSVIAKRHTDWTVHTGPLWFITCLFITELLFYLLSKHLRTKKSIGTALTILALLGCAYNKLNGEPLPWGIDIALISVGFYGAGFWYKEYHEKLDRLISWKTFTAFLALNIGAGYWNYLYSGERVDFYFSQLGNISLFYLSAFSGIGAYLVLIKRINRNGILQFIGGNSLIYLALHQKFVYLLFDQVTGKFDLGKILKLPMLDGLLYTLITAFILVPVVMMINHYFPFMLGKKRRRAVSGW